MDGEERTTMARLRKLSSALLLGITLLTACWTSDAQAQGQTTGARALGLAEAFTANATGNSALYHNPAGIGVASMYTAEGSYIYGPDSNSFAASVIDSKLNPMLALGLGYAYETVSKPQINGHDARAAVALTLIPQHLVLGVGGRYLRYDTNVADATVPSGFTLDSGATLNIIQGLSLGVSGNNLIDVCDGNTEAECTRAIAPRTAGGGIAFGSSLGFQINADIRANLSDKDNVFMTYGGGLELFFNQIIALRTGYKYVANPGAEDNRIGVGLGYRSRAAGIDLGYQYGTRDSESRVIASAQIYLVP